MGPYTDLSYISLLVLQQHVTSRAIVALGGGGGYINAFWLMGKNGAEMGKSLVFEGRGEMRI